MPLNALSARDERAAEARPEGDVLLARHLSDYLGVWPPRRPVEVVAWPARTQPAWDGALVPVIAVASPLGIVVSATPDLEPAIRPLAEASDDRNVLRERLEHAVAGPGRVSPWVTLRWTVQPADLPDEGVWVAADDPALPDWLRAFPGRALAVFDGNGAYLAGVGIKRHTAWGHEIAVGTAEQARGQGLARRLVAQAARAVLADGALPLYVHESSNVPSARVADAAGFPDDGWRLLAVWS